MKSHVWCWTSAWMMSICGATAHSTFALLIQRGAGTAAEERVTNRRGVVGAFVSAPGEEEIHDGESARSEGDACRVTVGKVGKVEVLVLQKDSPFIDGEREAEGSVD